MSLTGSGVLPAADPQPACFETNGKSDFMMMFFIGVWIFLSICAKKLYRQ